MARLRPSRSVITSLHTVCRKDSLDLTEDDRYKVAVVFAALLGLFYE
ncbi:hypothetical protein E2C01_083890 [Portunus trituberculatus]|uniref:Uncharacterized protein n=1 Tax=Portunus trituberculatus TaxID=210409 RepID=A0A5B7J3E5_PORTR|nr:hypothetical protein [Portunus trituberculatus]